VLLTHRFQILIATVFALSLAITPTIAAFANVTVTQLSSDPYTNTTSQHQTEVEPDTFSFGSTIVMATQVGRFTDGGSSNVGWATSTNNGVTWTHGFLPGTTAYSTPSGPYARVSDPSVAYDAAHNVWLISSLPLNASVNGVGVIVNRSTDGGLTWGNAVVVSSATGSDKNWIACDNTSTSPFYGHCYVEFDNNSQGNRILMSTSTDGGVTWGTALTTANNATGLGGQPLVQPTGTVIVPIGNANTTSILAFTSTNGGASWNATVTVSTVRSHRIAGNIRSSPLPSAEIDGSGKVYVAWQDCRFRTRCSSNDIVMSTSTNGTTWSAVTRIPTDAVNSRADHFIPGLAVDKSTSGATAHLALAYYYYPTANCFASTCQLDVGYVSSTNGGSTWTAKTQLAGPMTLSWIPNTTQGRMVGDYISTSFSNGLAFPSFAVATAPTGTTFHQAIYTTESGLVAAPGHNFASAEGAASAADSQSTAPAEPETRQ
jgi:hypothetical protein